MPSGAHHTYTVRNFDYWMVMCSCGWSGPRRPSRSYMEDDHIKHHDDVGSTSVVVMRRRPNDDQGA